jgi:hypothetical protein
VNHCEFSFVEKAIINYIISHIIDGTVSSFLIFGRMSLTSFELIAMSEEAFMPCTVFWREIWYMYKKLALAVLHSVSFGMIFRGGGTVTYEGPSHICSWSEMNGLLLQGV